MPQHKDRETIWCQNQLSYCKVFRRKFISNRNEKKKKTDKTIHLGLSILELSTILMYEFWYDCVKPKYGEKAKLCYMDTESFIVYLKR